MLAFCGTQTHSKDATLRVYLAGLPSALQTSLQRAKSDTQSPADSLRLEKLQLEQAIKI